MGNGLYYNIRKNAKKGDKGALTEAFPKSQDQEAYEKEKACQKEEDLKCT